MDALLRRRLMIASGGGSPTPPGPVTTIPYIRGGGNGSFIDTGITPDNTTKVIVWARNFNPGAGNLFGSRTSSTSNRFCLLTPGGANSGRIRIDYGNVTDTYADDQFANLSHYHKYEYYQGVLKIDDVTIASTGTQPTFSGTYNLYLFGNNNAGTLQSLNVPADICACQIYKGGTLVRDFTPVESPSVGLYDAVSETVFTNAGTGNFTYGSFNPDAYTPLEYISTSGNSYFITSIIGTYSLPIVAVFSPTGTSAVWYDLIGGRDATNRCQVFIGNTSTANSRSYGILGTASAKAMYSGSANYFKDKKTIIIKDTDDFSTYYNNSKLGNTVNCNVSSSYSTGVPLSIGATWHSSDQNFQNKFIGNYYYVGFGSQGSFVPGKVNNVAGLYDTYNDVFHPSESGVPFVAGPTI